LRVTRGVLFVLKTLFFSKKIQKQRILPCKKLLFSLSVQNEEIPSAVGVLCFEKLSKNQ